LYPQHRLCRLLVGNAMACNDAKQIVGSAIIYAIEAD
jgi:hypothetical protein